MKPLLVLIGGPPYVGKTTVAEIIFGRLDNCAWLDGDDVWRVNPFELEDPRLRMSDENMAFVVQTYLRGLFDYVILSSVVLYAPYIVKRILDRINGVEYDLLHICLVCDARDLVSRSQGRDGVVDPDPRFLRESLDNDILKLDTSGKSPLDVAEDILGMAVARHNGQKRSAFGHYDRSSGLRPPG